MTKKIQLISLLLFLSTSIFAQCKYEEYTTKDNVELSYKWKRTKLFDKTSPKVVLIKLENENDYSALISFKADYYLDGVLEETNTITDFCMKANKTYRGKINGIILETEKLNNGDFRQDGFKLEFNDIKIEKTEGCSSEE